MSYQMTENGIFKDDGREQLQLTNFTAQITQQTRVHDGNAVDTNLTIVGKMGKDELPEIMVPARDFAAMTWVAIHWGIVPVIMPIPGAERDIRAAIQYASKPKTIDVYKHTGWSTIKKEPAYLHAGGAVTKAGNNTSIHVSLPADLARYTFNPSKDPSPDSFAASMNIPAVGEPKAIWPMLIATYRAAVGPTDFALHLSGRTGTFKTELCSLIQSHFGEDMDARHLPGSWSSTANALEALAYNAKNAILVIDDFVPFGTSWQVRALQKTADQIIRGQGNQAGRARLSDRTTLQTTYYPRGVILSTGEDVPDGHSIRARMMITELSPGDIDAEKLTLAQERRPHYQNAMFHWISWLADGLTEKRKELKTIALSIRDDNRGLGHTRTPAMVGELIATLRMLMVYATQEQLITMKQADAINTAAEKAILESAVAQTAFLEEVDPADAFVETIRQTLAGHLAHIRTKDGNVPEKPEQCGWTSVGAEGELKNYKPHGPQIGWTVWAKNELYFDINAMSFLKRHAGGKLSMTRQTLLKRLKDGGQLARTDEARQRNTIRVSCQGHTRHVICTPLDLVFAEEDE